MTQDDSDLLPLRVTRVGHGGKRSFDKRDKQRLVEACLQPGVSVAGMALKAGVNANQLRRWIRQYQEKHNGGAAPIESVRDAPAAFLPVVEIGGVARLPESQAARPSPPPLSSARLTARLPNGVSVELECAGQDATLVAAMIAALGAR